jgi:DNA topoisomerase-1
VRGRKKVVREAIKTATAALGNTTTICRRYYIHPTLPERYEAGVLHSMLEQFRPKNRRPERADEEILVAFLKQCDEAPRGF